MDCCSHWLRCASTVDVALTEAAIGGGLGGVLLSSAASRLRDAEAKAAQERPSGALRIVSAAALAAADALGLDGRRSAPARSYTNACPGSVRISLRPVSATRSPRCSWPPRDGYYA